MFNDRELATTLAALRHWQRDLSTSGANAAVEYPQLADVQPLTADQIDRLCERLNLGQHESAFIELCQRVAESAENWGDCSDAREAMAVFRELGAQCREFLERQPVPSPSRPAGYLLYDFDEKVLITTKVFATYAEAVEDAGRLRDVIVVPFGLEVAEDETDDDETDDAAIDRAESCECELPGEFCSGVPGIIARVEHGRLAAGAEVQRCDLCERYESDEAALAKLREIGIA